MAGRFTNRKLELFAIHSHIASRNGPYEEIADLLGEISPQHRVVEIGPKAIAIPHVARRGKFVLMQVFEGPVGVNPLIFDTTRASPRYQVLEQGEIVAQITHAAFDFAGRRVAIEYVRSGAKADDISHAITKILSEQMEGLQDFLLEFAPVIDEQFVREIDRFERIREARLIVTRPNASWTDHYTELSKTLEESNGGRATVGVSASRGGALRKRGGIIDIIREVVSDKFPYLKTANITGRRKGEDAEATLSTRKHSRFARKALAVDDNNQVNPGEVFRSLEGLIRSSDN